MDGIVLILSGIGIHEIPGHHQNFFKEPHIQVLAEKLNACLESVDESARFF
jgi:thioesterase domain-containing protein